MDFFKKLIGYTPKTEEAAKAAVNAAKAKKDAITEKCISEQTVVDKEISDAEAELLKVNPITPFAFAPVVNQDDVAVTEEKQEGGKKKGGKSNKKQFSKKLKGGKRAKSQKKRR